MTGRVTLAVLVAATAPVLSGPLAGQSQSALTGFVRDTAGRPLARAAVAVPFAGRTAVTDDNGRYLLAPVLPGRHAVVARALGHRPARDTVEIAAGDTVQLDFTLVPSALEVAPLVVTAAKRSQLVEEAVTSIAVIEETDIARRAVANIDEAVDKAPGVQFLDGQVNIRGSSGYVRGLGSRVLLLVDGVPANQGDRGGINWDLVPVDEVERVEVVKGAGSSLYGSAALGGVVNLITRDVPVGAHARVRATAGAFAPPPHDVWSYRDGMGTHGGFDVSASYGSERVRGRIAGGARTTEGYREQDAADHWQLAGRGLWLGASGRDRVDVSGAWAVNQYQVPLLWCVEGQCDDRGQSYQPFMIDSTVRGDHTDSRKGYLTATYSRTATDRVDWQVRGSLLRTHFTDVRRTGSDFSVSNRWGGEVRAQIRPDGRPVTTVGAEGAYVWVWSDIFGTHTQSEYAAYGETETWVGAARISTGARIDFIATDGGGLSAVASPRIGAVLPSGWGVWRASVGRGFRAPSLAERFVTTTAGPFVVVPNPALTPETAWSFEAGFGAPLGDVILIDAAVFWNDATDMVEPVFIDTLYQIQFNNVARARLRGLDASAVAVAADGRLRGTASWVWLDARELARDTVPERPLAFRPEHVVTVTADWRVWRRLSVGADWRYASRLERVDLYETDPRVPSNTVDLRAGWEGEPLAIRLLFDNAFNYIHGYLPRTLAPVRSLSVVATWTR